MKLFKTNYVPVLFLAGAFLSCEVNDPLKELSDPQGFTAAVYFSPISPVTAAGAEIPCNIQYWTLGDEFGEMQLLQRTTTLEVYTIQLADVSYQYSSEISEDASDLEKEVVEAFDHDFTNWVPHKNAYVLNFDYYVEPDLAKRTYTDNITTKEEFETLMSPAALANFYTRLTAGLTKDQLETLLVDTHGVVTKSQLDAYYDAEGLLTENGQSEVEETLQSVGAGNLIGDDYQLIQSNSIILNFRIVNGFGEEAESVSRYINVN